MATTDLDAGMRAVARVRAVREQDSRLGLARAAADEREAGRRLHAVTEQLARTAEAGADGSDPAAYLALRAGAGALAVEVTASRAALASASTLTAMAREHWQRDHTRLSAVELLLERRAADRRAERERRERAQVDELATVRWLRARTSVPSVPAVGTGAEVSPA